MICVLSVVDIFQLKLKSFSLCLVRCWKMVMCVAKNSDDYGGQIKHLRK